MDYNDYLSAIGHVENSVNKTTPSNDNAEIELANLHEMLDVLQHSSAKESSYQVYYERFEELLYSDHKKEAIDMLFKENYFPIYLTSEKFGMNEDYCLLYCQGKERFLFSYMQEFACRTSGEGYSLKYKEVFDREHIPIDSKYDMNSFYRLRNRRLNSIAYFWIRTQLSSSYPSDPSALDILTALYNEGNAQATNNLGWMYYKGLGVSQDSKLAMEFFNKAEKLGSSVAKHNKDSLYSVKGFFAIFSDKKRNSVDVKWEQ